MLEKNFSAFDDRGKPCPWRLAYFFDNIFRRLLHNPAKVFAPHIRPGMRVLDVGCGMGFGSINAAKLTGPTGSVVSVDVQPEMLEVLKRRAVDAGVAERITPVLCPHDALCVDGPFDFVIAFWMVHEAPDLQAFMEQVHAVMAGGARLLMVEPRFHIRRQAFLEELEAGLDAGLSTVDTPKIAMSRAVLFEKNIQA
jgi:ubiquinone/menaquinone biosynthesis C-methylase UbiE